MKKILIMMVLVFVSNVSAKIIPILASDSKVQEHFYAIPASEFLKSDIDMKYFYFKGKKQANCGDTKIEINKLINYKGKTPKESISKLIEFYKKQYPYAYIEYKGTKTDFRSKYPIPFDSYVLYFLDKPAKTKDGMIDHENVILTAKKEFTFFEFGKSCKD